MRALALLGLVIVVGWSGCASAQTGSSKTVPQITAEINTLFPSGTRALTAASLRQVTLDMLKSSINGTPSGGGVLFVDAAPYNAVGDGVTDDTAAVSSAFSACGAVGGGVVFGPHRYLINSANVTVPSFCTVYCLMQPEGFSNRLGATNRNTSPYTILLNPNYTINMSFVSVWRGCMVLNSQVNLNPTNVNQSVAIPNTFAGTAFNVGFEDVTIQDALIGGFSLGVNANTDSGRLYMSHVYIDATQCITSDSAHDISHFYNVQCEPWLSFSFSRVTYPITNIADNGSGLYRVTVSSPTVIQTGEPVYVDASAVGAQSSQNIPWTATVIDSTHIDLQGSSTAGATFTGTTVTDSFTISGVSSFQFIGVGDTITGTGIPGGTTVTWISPNGTDLGISNQATASGTVSLTVADTPYVAGGTLYMTSYFRTGAAFTFTNSEAVECTECQSFSHAIGFHLGTGDQWFNCEGCEVDGLNGVFGVGTTGVLIDGSAGGASFVGGSMQVLGTSVRINTTNHGPNNFVGMTMNNGPYQPIIEVDNGLAVLTGNNSANQARYILQEDSADGTVLVGNAFTHQIALETSAGFQRLTAIGNTVQAGTFGGNLQLGNYLLTTGSTSNVCGTNGLTSCATRFGGSVVFNEFVEQDMTNGGSFSLSGNVQSNLFHAAAPITGYTITFFSTATTGLQYEMYFDQAVSGLTVNGTGASVVGMPANAAANTWYRCRYNNSLSEWACSAG